MTNYAVLIGNSEFPKEPNLRPLTCPSFDVDGLMAELSAENRGQFQAENIITLKNKPHYEVLEELNQIFKIATRDDLVLLYYSGHGLPNNKNNLYLSTFNTKADLLESTAVSFNQIYELINAFYCKKIIIILDCCYSGIAGGAMTKGDIVSQLQTMNDKVTGTFLITASSNDQVAQEQSGGRYSLFTKHLIAGLETGEADKDGDGFISIDELFRYVSKKVTDENGVQRPKLFVKNKTEELIIAKSGRDSRKERAEKIRLLLLELEKQDENISEIRVEVLSIAKMPISQLSQTELLKDKLLEKLLNKNLTFFSFVRGWDRFAFEIEKIEQEKLFLEKTKQEKAAREKMEQDKTAKEQTFIKEIDEFNTKGNKFYGRGNYSEAANWYRKSAERGNASAQYYLGRIYHNGYAAGGVLQDYVEAVKWYKKAAEQGNVDGQVNLGFMYRNGYGVPQDYAEAVKWYKKAAEKGDAGGQNNLGTMYENGLGGLPQDKQKALELYQRASVQNRNVQHKANFERLQKELTSSPSILRKLFNEFEW